jgi:hypothetical protein
MSNRQQLKWTFSVLVCFLLAAESGASSPAPEREYIRSSRSSLAWIIISARGPGEVWFHDFRAALPDTQTQNSFPTNSNITLHARPMTDAIFLGWFGAIHTNSSDFSYVLKTNQTIEARFIARTTQLKAVATSNRGVLVSLTNSFPVGIDLEATSDFKEWKPFLKHSESNKAPFEISNTNGPQLFLRSILRPP